MVTVAPAERLAAADGEGSGWRLPRWRVVPPWPGCVPRDGAAVVVGEAVVAPSAVGGALLAWAALVGGLVAGVADEGGAWLGAEVGLLVGRLDGELLGLGEACGEGATPGRALPSEPFHDRATYPPSGIFSEPTPALE